MSRINVLPKSVVRLDWIQNVLSIILHIIKIFYEKFNFDVDHENYIYVIYNIKEYCCGRVTRNARRFR